MSLWSRIANAFGADRLSREIDEELQSHIAEGIAKGRAPAEARRAFGSALRAGEESQDLRLIPWLESLRADAIFAWRQLRKRKVASAAAILSLGLGIGACTSAFRLIDALLWRPLPVAHTERLYDVFRQQIGWDGKPGTFDGWAYPAFREMRAAVAGRAELIAISNAERADLTYRSDQEMEKAYTQYVSGWMFTSFGLRPAWGRRFTENDDRAPGAHPYAVISHDYWTHRFSRDTRVIGCTFRMGERIYEIVGVAPEGFTGTEPGTMIDIFLPAMMHPSVTRKDSTWHRTLAVLNPGVAVQPIREKLNAISLAFEQERAKGFTNVSKQNIENYLHQTVMLEPAPSGVSDMQAGNRRPLAALGVLVGLVLLMACANVANLMTAQAAARAREMALRVSIGAGRGRLVQLVLVESAVLACLAAGLGAAFAWWSAPLVAGMINPRDNPARLVLPADWRVLGFGLVLTIAVTFLFGLTPAWRTSATKPVTALRGGEDWRSRRRIMHTLLAAQATICFLVLFVAGLFTATFSRLSNQPTGFSAERLLTLDASAARPQPAVFWNQVTEHLSRVPGVEAVSLAGAALLGGQSWNNSISINGGPPSDDLTYFLHVSPGWVGVMKISLMGGREFRASDTDPSVTMVNDTFARRYFKGENPIGKTFDETQDEGGRTPHRIVGVVRDACYQDVRGPIPPVAYVPLGDMRRATFMVRTSSENPMAMAAILRREVPRGRPEFRVNNIRTQQEIDDGLTIRERLLAMLGLFFAGVALLLAAVGFYGVLSYSVVQRRKEIGIRIAIGATAGNIARLVTAEIFAMVFIGGLAGIALGGAAARYIEGLLYQVKSGDPAMLGAPFLIILAAALLAALPAVIHAVRIDPVEMLRAE